MHRLFAKRRKKKFGLYKMKNLLLTYLAFAVYSNTSAQTQTVGAFSNTENSYDGYTLYAPIPGFDTYLINNCGEVVNEWTSDYRIGLSAYLLEDGSLLRTGQLPSYADHPFSGGGTGGRVERFSWDGNLIWFSNFSEKVNPKWLYHWLKSEIGQNQIHAFSIGSTQKALTIEA